MTDILHDMQPLFDFLNKPHNFPSLMLPYTVQLPNKRTCFLALTEKIKVHKGKIVDCDDGIPNFEITRIYGSNTHCTYVELINLETDSVITIEI